MKKNFRTKLILTAFFAVFITLCATAQKTYTYKSVPGDPLKARIYTLDNGLTVYMTVYKDAPRIQTYIATRGGSKNDPADATGLAHYFEHLMFKGTKSFGTSDYTKEEPLLNKIDSLFEVYRFTKDTLQRTYLYHVIDSVSTLASKYAIPNEYDKLVGIIGADGTNAFTSNEMTVFVNDIPSNQLQNWLTIESDRFKNPVLRLFHTELETVYEEKNMTLANDQRKVYEDMLAGLFLNHPYGTQTTIGTQEHLKNPSLKRIKEFFASYYVPNNMAICLSGDFDPDATIKMIDETFGKYTYKEVPPFTFKPESPITSPVVKEVLGPDAESVSIAFRFKGANSQDAKILTMIDMILSNSVAGLIDLNLVQAQKVLSASSSPMIMKDYSAEMLSGKPKEGQTLEEVRDLLLGQIELIKNGDFPDWLLTAIINDLKLQETKSYEDNNSRAMAFVNAFILGTPWEDEVTKFESLAKITKQDLIDFAKANFTDKNYVIVYKRTGVDKSIVKVQKPKITPIKINREESSAFLKQIENNKVADIEPVYLDYNKDIQKFNIKDNIQVLYKENTENTTFDLKYVFKMGNNNSKMISIAFKYLDYLGTSKYTPEQLKQEFYKIGCSYKFVNSDDEINIALSGLSENMDAALILLESILSDAQPDQKSLDNMVSDILKKRKDAKLNKQSILGTLVSYGIYGPVSPLKNRYSEAELKALKPADIITFIKDLNSFEHHVLYYGPLSQTSLTTTLNKNHNCPATLKAVPAPIKFVQLPTTKNQVYQVEFPMKQAEILMLNKGGLYDKNSAAISTLFNEYFGGSMNSLVFQELREAKALAYTALSFWQQPQDKEKAYYSLSYIATQTDKMGDALKGLFELMNNMPESEKSFELAKSSLIQKMRTDRITKADILDNYEADQKLGLTYDIRKDIFEQLPKLTFADVKAFEEKNVKDKPHTILVIGDKKLLDLKLLKTYGKIKYLTLEEIFGY
jgi:predicted Zn-dependent peptidase